LSACLDSTGGINTNPALGYASRYRLHSFPCTDKALHSVFFARPSCVSWSPLNPIASRRGGSAWSCVRQYELFANRVTTVLQAASVKAETSEFSRVSSCSSLSEGALPTRELIDVPARSNRSLPTRSKSNRFLKHPPLRPRVITANSTRLESFRLPELGRARSSIIENYVESRRS